MLTHFVRLARSNLRLGLRRLSARRIRILPRQADAARRPLIDDVFDGSFRGYRLGQDTAQCRYHGDKVIGNTGLQTANCRQRSCPKDIVYAKIQHFCSTAATK